MSENQINNLGSIVKEILNVLSSFQQQILAALNYLKVLPDLIRKVLQAINESTTRQINAAGEMEIIKKTANLDSKRHQISAENEAIIEFKEQLNDDIAYIQKKYDSINAELDEEAVKRVQEIDEHLLSLPDFFPREFILNYSENISPLIEKIGAEYSEINKKRADIIGSRLTEVVDKINSFLNDRKKFFEEIEIYNQKEMGHDINDLELPLYIIESNKELFYYFPGEVNIPTDINTTWFKYLPNEKIKFYADKLNSLKDENQTYINQLPWGNGNKNNIESRLLEFADQHFTVNKNLIKKAVKNIIRNSDVLELKN